MSKLLWSDERIAETFMQVASESGEVTAEDVMLVIKGMRDSYEQELARQKAALMAELSEVEQTLGAALGYARYCDDPKNFPHASAADGVCVGDHAAGTLAQEAAQRLAVLGAKQAKPTADNYDSTFVPDENTVWVSPHDEDYDNDYGG